MTFILKSATQGRTEIRLWSKSESDHTESCHVTLLIGKNGTGKSQLLSSIASAFQSLDRRGKFFQYRPLHNNRTLRLSYQHDSADVILHFAQGKFKFADVNAWRQFDIPKIPHPSRVIATTITPFDKFPLNTRAGIPDDGPTPCYRYLGTKVSQESRGVVHQLNRVVNSLFLSPDKGEASLRRLSNVFRFLGYFPTISVEYRLSDSDTVKKILKIPDVAEPDDVERMFERSRNPKLREWSAEFPDEIPEIIRTVKRLIPSVGRKNRVALQLNLESGSYSKGSRVLFNSARQLKSLSGNRTNWLQASVVNVEDWVSQLAWRCSWPILDAHAFTKFPMLFGSGSTC